jgi:hypothetical protein
VGSLCSTQGGCDAREIVDKQRFYTVATPYREPSLVAPHPTVSAAAGDSQSIKRYRRFFQTHDLHGLPQRETQTKR